MNPSVPIPQGKYVPATRYANLIYTAGMTPRLNGVLLLSVKVKADDDIQIYRSAVRQAAANALTATRAQLNNSEKISKVLQMVVYVNAEESFTLHSRLADFASEYICEELGEPGIAARTAVGVASLPGNAPLEIQMICAAD